MFIFNLDINNNIKKKTLFPFGSLTHKFHVAMPLISFERSSGIVLNNKYPNEIAICFCGVFVVPNIF